MDDNNIPALKESQQEWSIKLLRIILPHILDGVYAMFTEAKSICDKTEEKEKYLMTFQNILSRVPKWNNDIVNTETKRIVEQSTCSYLEDLITCVHITHLKLLSAVRTGKTQKKIEINIPKLPQFIHSVYIHLSRELYTKVYLFDPSLTSIQLQKNKEKVKELVKQTIMDTIRDNIPVEQLLRAYLDETTELMDEPKKTKKEDRSLRFSETDMTFDIPAEPLSFASDPVEEPPEPSDPMPPDPPECSPPMKISDEIVPIQVEDLSPIKEVVPENEPAIVLDIMELS